MGGGRFVILLPLSTCFLPRFPTYEGRERGRGIKGNIFFSFLLFSAVIGNGGNVWWRKGLIFSGIWERRGRDSSGYSIDRGGGRKRERRHHSHSLTHIYVRRKKVPPQKKRNKCGLQKRFFFVPNEVKTKVWWHGSSMPKMIY